MKKILALSLCLVLALAVALPAQAILEFIIIDEILDEVKATPEPTPAPAPEPTPNLLEGISSPFNPGKLDIHFPTPAPTKPPYFQDPGSIPKTLRPILPTMAPPSPTKAPAPPKATPKPTQKPPASKGGQQKGLEATSFGLYFEELRPKLTDSWYMFTPLDLASEGVMSYPLVAGNAYIVGSVNVVVQGGQVTITYQAAPGVSTGREFFALFPNLDAIQTLSAQLLAGQARPFGQPINIQQAFGEDRKVVLYLNNTVDFNAAKAGVTAFVPDQHRFFMQNLLPLLD